MREKIYYWGLRPLQLILTAIFVLGLFSAYLFTFWKQKEFETREAQMRWAQQALVQLQSLQNASLTFVQVPTPQKASGLENALQKAEAHFYPNAESAEAALLQALPPSTWRSLQAARQEWKSLQLPLQGLLALPKQSGLSQTDSLLQTYRLQSFEEAQLKLAQSLLFIQTDTKAAFQNELAKTQGEFQMGLSASLIGSFLLVVILIFLIRQYFLSPIQKIATQVGKMAQGDLEKNISYQQNNNLGQIGKGVNILLEEVRRTSFFIQNLTEGNLEQQYQSQFVQQTELEKAILRMQSQMQQVAEQESQRRWIADGLARFVEILRQNNNDLQKLADDLILNLVSYMQVNQGGLFIVRLPEDEAAGYFELLACVAYDRKKHQTKTIGLREGLLGQVYVEKEVIYLKEIPNEYLQITSGLGQANPQHLLIVPLKTQEKVLGVLELASFAEIPDYKRDFIVRLGESLAVALQNVQTNEHTKVLLAESQKLAQNLKDREEVLKRALEKMKAVQGEMETKELQLSGQLTAINSTLATVSYSPKGLILQANNIFLELVGYDFAEIERKHHQLFMPLQEGKSEQYNAFWQELAAGKAQSGEFKFLGRNGIEIWLAATFTPMFDVQGKVESILQLAQDITEVKTRSLDYEQQLKAVENSAALALYDKEGILLYANQEFSALTGYQVSDILGKNHKVFALAQESQGHGYVEFWEKLRTGESIRGEYERIGKNGEHYWEQASYNPILDLNGKVVKVIAFSQDITTRKHLELVNNNQILELQSVEEELRQNLEEMAATQEELERQALQNEAIKNELAARQGVIDKSALVTESDLYGTITYVNERFTQISQYTPEEAVGKPHSILRHPDTPKAVFKKMWETIKAGKIFQATYANRAKDGSTYWVETTIAPILDKSGKPVKYIGVRFDITEKVKQQDEVSRLLFQAQQQNEELRAQEEEIRQNMEEMAATQEALQRKEEELSASLNAIDRTLATISFAPDGKILDFNESFEKIIGYPKSELIGRHHSLLLEEADSKSKGYEKFWQQLRAGIAQSGEFKRLNKNGDFVWLSATYTPIIRRDGSVERVMKLAIDITDTKIKTQQYAQELEKLAQNFAILSIDAKGKISDLNEVFSQITNYGKQELIGRDWQYLFTPLAGSDLNLNEWSEKLWRGTNQKALLLCKSKQEKTPLIKFLVDALPLQDEEGEIRQVVFYLSPLEG
ncbi:PAS domain S-box protein [Hugenholtzia roseola]|uniref:PAS domain S-box protein n=1 Tax=Hugenholtzia roseola TaxID=1002 RepID=UPI0013774D99|nr:PAS domain S-box protein [Hugenholtzia roseola]